MSGSEAGASGSDVSGTVDMFKCKSCGDGKLFKASEKDEHRRWHREQRQRSSGGRGGRRQRVAAAEPSEATTMFEREGSPAKTTARKRTGGKPGGRTPKKERRARAKSVKHANEAHAEKTMGKKNPGA